MFEKYEKLKRLLSSYERLIVAFSGGVDSSFLLKTAYDVLGENVLAISLQTPYIAESEIEEARRIADEIGARHLVLVKPWMEELRTNPKERCYLCKHALFSSLTTFAQQRDFRVIAEGSNVDDTMEKRPGRVALLELSILTPLLDVGLSKAEIRLLSKAVGLSTWNKPSYACLLTRFSYGVVVEESALKKVHDAEAYLIAQGYPKMRVRYEANIARIEMEKEDALRLMNDGAFSTIIEEVKSYGFLHVTLDLQGYRYERKGV
ncbi:ATP-dependent sacrificial sulfur transferase LarE [Sulfurospirillum deleyianum]|uniref:Queuosine synthesis-like protein n=1 Tax=Sulfurospirillum deleyianum (strain ATCC 51133 / DSM 6946 / 5175) TaxID=525898 RepID=D1B2I0_SULD5|nr:ATP-dependent sacrificial sulfur transferase LarE [Sulfurospirillum deleyianum]ACZ12300.1 Queuosine synthesis-like protein [Sulfurospirillum deleyianum DSM 6946]